MKENKKEEENFSQGNRKTVLGFRIHNEAKSIVFTEAQKLDISASEYVESIVLNRKSLLTEIENLRLENDLLKDKILRQFSQHSSKVIESDLELEKVKDEDLA